MFFKKRKDLKGKKATKRGLAIWNNLLLIFILIVGNIAIANWVKSTQGYVTDYTMFLEKLADHEVKAVEWREKSSILIYTDQDGRKYHTSNPKTVDFKGMLLEQGIRVEEPWIIMEIYWIQAGRLLFNIITLISIKTIFEIKKAAKEENQYPDETFRDIAGNETAKADLKAKVQGIIEPDKFKEVGAKPTSGVLLIGPPGTGKTKLARALAGEMEIPLITCSGSDFVEVYVGKGAKRIRKVFKEAREKAPCILFIDEIDIVGAQRQETDILKDSQEQEQTLTALLTELNNSEGIFVIGATNREKVLDKALIRPGRLHDHIVIGRPTKEDRICIIRKYLESKKIQDDIEISYLAKLTSGWVGAGIESLLNEAALLALRDDRMVICKKDIEAAHFKMITKGYPYTCEQDEEMKEVVAWHEAGHALCTKLLTKEEVAQVSIIPNTAGIGGYVLTLSEEEMLPSKSSMLAKIKAAYAGRAAEEILKGNNLEVTIGAANDIMIATEYIKEMLTTYGMGEMSLLNIQAFTPGGEMILEEASELAERLYHETLELLKEHKVTLKNIADKLIEQEMIREEELQQLIV